MHMKLEQHQLANKLWEFSLLQHFYDEDNDAGQHNRNFTFSGQGKILIALSQEGNLSQKELAERLNLRPQSAAEFIAKLVKRGYVSKVKSPTDGRIYLINLTEKGQSALQQIDTSIPFYLDYLSEDEKMQLGAILDKLIQVLNEKIDQQGNTLHNAFHKLILHHMTSRLHDGEEDN